MTTDAKHQTTQAVMEAIIPLVDRVRKSGDEEAFASLGPTLIVLAAALMRNQLGSNAAATALETFAVQIRGGQYDQLFDDLKI